MNRQPDKRKKDPIYREENDEGSGNTAGTNQDETGGSKTEYGMKHGKRRGR